MQYTQSGNTYVIKIEKGEELMTTLIAFCAERDITCGYFFGIGAAEQLSCGYYALHEKKYYFTAYDELVEVVSLTGNVALKEGKPFIHAHGVFTGTDNRAFGGHIEHITSGIVIEVMLTVVDASVERTLDEEIGLYLYNCADEFYRPIPASHNVVVM